MTREVLKNLQNKKRILFFLDFIIWIHRISYNRSQRITFLAQKKMMKGLFSAVKSNSNLKNVSRKMFESEDRHQHWAESKFGLGRDMHVFIIADASNTAEFQSGQRNPVLLLFPPFIFFLCVRTAQHSFLPLPLSTTSYCSSHCTFSFQF